MKTEEKIPKSFRLKKEIELALKAYAEKEGRSENNCINIILKKFFITENNKQ